MITKDETKAIEKELTIKEIIPFLKTLNIIGRKNLSIPQIRAYAEESENKKIKS